MPSLVLPRCATPAEWPAAFALLFSHLSPGERDYRCARAVDLIAAGELDPRGIFVVPGTPSLIGTCVAQAVPGAGGLIWPPVVIRLSSHEDALVQHACAWLKQQGARLAQCLLPDDEAFLAKPLLRHGFAAITGLLYLRHDLQLPPDLLHTPVRLAFECFDPARPALFQQTLLTSYEHTLDCPEVNGLRTIDEILAGHQAQGRHDPSRWWLARHAGTAVGVLLVTEPVPNEWEIAYVGLVPAARGQGLGRELLLHALCEARAAGVHRVVLSVDDRNVPARKLYHQAGFEPYDHRHVLLATWG